VRQPHLPHASYVKLLQDRSVTQARQDVMIARLARPRVHEITAGHLAMLSNPVELSAIIAQEATSAA
jgi:hypothetical protein